MTAPLEKSLQQAIEEREQRLKSSLYLARGVNPDQHARQIRISGATGVPLRLVEGAETELEEQANLGNLSTDRIRAESPVLARHLEDPNFAKLAQDDIGFLGWVEQKFKAFVDYGGELGRQSSGSRRRIDYSDLATREMLAEKGWPLQEPLTAEEREAMWHAKYVASLTQTIPYEYRGNWWTKYPLYAAQQIPNMWELTKEALGWGVVGGGLGLFAGRPGVGFRVGAGGGTWWGSFKLEAGPLWHDLREVRDEYGNPINPDEAWALAFVGGSLIGALDAVSFGRTASTLQPVKQAVKRKLLGAAASRSFRQAAVNFLKRYGIAVGTETATEAVQELISVMMEDLGALAAREDVDIVDAFVEWMEPGNVQATLERAEPRMAQAAEVAFGSTLMIAGATSSVSLGVNVAQSQKAQRDYVALQETGKKVQQSALFKRHKGAFEAFAAAALEAERDPNAYVELGPFLASLEEQRIESTAALEAMGVEDQVAEAQDITGDVRMPLSRVLALADQPYYDAMLVDMRTSLEAMTPRRAEEKLAEIQASLVPEETAAEEFAPVEEAVTKQERPLEAAQAQTAATETQAIADATRRAERLATAPSRESLDAASDLIEKDLQGKIERASRRVGKGFESVFAAAPYNARLVAEHYRAMGALLGEDPYKLYRQARLTVAGPRQREAQLTRALNAIREGRQPQGPRMRRYPVLSMLAERGGIHPDSPAAAELRKLGVSNKTTPGIFRRKPRAADAPQPMRDLDALVLSEEPLFQGRGRAEGYVDPQEILEAVAAELAGKPTRTEEELQAIADAQEYQTSVEQVLSELDLDPATMSNEEIIAALREAETGIESMTLFQPAYHGSPHRFDKFTLEHIGTGEGAQSYGWGLYFAGRREVGEFYRANLAGQAEVFLDGVNVRELDPRLLAGVLSTDILNRSALNVPQARELEFIRAVGSVEGAIERVVNAIRANREDPSPRQDVIEGLERRLDTLRSLADRVEIKERGQLYKVDIPEDSELLDWDKPLNEQPQVVQDALRNLDPTLDVGAIVALGVPGMRRELTGEEIYRFWARETQANPGNNRIDDLLENLGLDAAGMDAQEAVSRALLVLGIRGLRYLDQGSRTAGEGTHNYVIWDEDAINILEMFYQRGETEPRAFITFNPERTEAAIRLLKTADASSFLHETGHLFLESLRSFAARPDAPEQLRADWETLREHWGLAEAEAPSREHHEWFAEQFEAYTATGRAPSLRLREVFERFRQWLRTIWDIARRRPVEVQSDIAEIFDRLLTTPRDRLEEQVREEVTDRIQQTPAYRAVEDVRAGVPYDVAAEAWGFANSEELEMYVATDPNWDTIIDRETKERMRREHPEPDFDFGTYAATDGREAIFTNERAAALAEELNTLRQQAGMARDVGISETMRARAHRLIQGKRIREIRPLEYQAQERRAGAEALEAARRGQIGDAAKAKERQLLLHHLFVAAKKAESEVDRHHKHLGRYNRATIRQAIAEGKGQHLAQIDGLRSRFGLSTRPVDPNATNFWVWVTEQREEHNVHIVVDWAEVATHEGPNPSQNMLSTDTAIPWQELRLDQLEGLRDTLTSIETTARNAQKVWSDKQGRTLDEVVGAMAAAIYANHEKQSSPIEHSPTRRQMLVLDKDWLHAKLTKLEFMWNWFANYEPQGVVHTTLQMPVEESEDVELRMKRDVSLKRREIESKLSRSERSELYSTKKILIPEVGRKFTTMELFMMVLNWGNLGNREALLRGFGWTEEQAQACMFRLPKAYFDMAQDIWDYNETFRPQVDALEFSLSGTRLKWVEAEPFETPYGTYPGGYIPLDYDPRTDWNVQARKERERALEKFPASALRPMTRHSHRKARIGSGGKMVNLDISVWTNHLRDVVHDIAYAKTIQDLDRLTRHPLFREAVETTYGTEGYKLIAPYIQSLAYGPEVPVGRMQRGAARARAGVTMVTLAGKFSVLAVQLLGYFQAWDYMIAKPGLKGAYSGTKYLTKAIADFYAHPAQMAEKVRFIYERAPQMRERLVSWDREAMRAAQISGLKGIVGERASLFLSTIGFMEALVSWPTWLGAYSQGMNDLFVNDPNAEAKSIAWATEVVRNSQGSGLIKDLAEAYRTGGAIWTWFTMFQTFWSAIYNQMNRRYNLTKKHKLHGAPGLIAFMAGSWMLSSVLSAWASGHGPEEDEDKLLWAAKELAYFPIGPFPIIRDFVGPAIHPEYGGYDLTPVGRIGEQTVRVLQKMPQAIEEGELDRSMVKSLNFLLGVYFKYPADQLWRTGEEIFDYMTGQDADFSLRDAAYGERR